MSKFLRIILVIVAILLLMLISGCENKTEDTGKAFIGGDKGLLINFIDGAPPAEVFDTNYPFNINIKIENVGEWDINNAADATVEITGIDPKDFSKTAESFVKNADSSLTGAHRNPQGEAVKGTITNVEFPNLQYAGTLAGTSEFTIRANVCYTYGTKINSKICVLEDLLGSKKRTEVTEICDPNTAKDTENSGAPVHVTDFKETAVASDKLSFSFKISHVGTGVISKPNTECSNEIADKDKVIVTVNTGLDGLSCSGILGGGTTGETTLYNGEREIMCTQQLPSPRGNYEKQISITLQYDYEDHIDKALKVKHSVG